MKKIFSPKQVFLATLIGTPIAGAYCLYKNNVGLKKTNKLVIAISIIATLLGTILVSLYYISEGDRNKEEIFGYSVIIYVLIYLYNYPTYALKKQLSKNKIQNLEEYDFQSNWTVFIVTLISFILFPFLQFPIELIIKNLTL